MNNYYMKRKIQSSFFVGSISGNTTLYRKNYIFDEL